MSDPRVSADHARGIDQSEPRWRTASLVRRLGYALLPGEGFSYLLHLRPREWPIMAAHTLLGAVLALGVRALLRPDTGGAVAFAVFIWVVLLNGGTLAINSAFDRDEGDVGYLDAPPPPPRHLAVVALLMMMLGQGLAFLLPVPFRWAYAACFALSVLYSVPPVRLKAVAGADWIINIVGFGMLTPYAAWAATGRPLSVAGAWIIGGFGPLFASLYPLTQIYQLREDAARGDRTMAIRLGVRASLVVAILAAVVAFACFARALFLGGSGSRAWGSLAFAATLWLGILGHWILRAPTMNDDDHKRGMYLALGAWALIDVVVLAVYWSGAP